MTKTRRASGGISPSLCSALVLLLLLSGLSVFSGSARADREACIAAHEEAQLTRMRGRYRAAHAQLLLCAQSTCPALIRNDCIAQLEDVNASLPSVVFAVSDREGRDLFDVRVSANGELLTDHIDGRAVAIDPGVYELRFEAGGFEPAVQKVAVLEAQKQRLIRIQLSSDAAAQPPKLAAHTDNAASLRARYITSYALWGGAVLSLAAGTALGIVGKNELDKLKKSCADDDCSKSERAHGKRLYIGADVAFGVGGALTLAATWLFFATRKAAQNTDRLALRNLRLALAADGARVGWSAPF